VGIPSVGTSSPPNLQTNNVFPAAYKIPYWEQENISVIIVWLASFFVLFHQFNLLSSILQSDMNFLVCNNVAR
jgi:hypothetical protein